MSNFGRQWEANGQQWGSPKRAPSCLPFISVTFTGVVTSSFAMVDQPNVFSTFVAGCHTLIRLPEEIGSVNENEFAVDSRYSRNDGNRNWLPSCANPLRYRLDSASCAST